jgi:hypothetical protein
MILDADRDIRNCLQPVLIHSHVIVKVCEAKIYHIHERQSFDIFHNLGLGLVPNLQNCYASKIVCWATSTLLVTKFAGKPDMVNLQICSHGGAVNNA